MIMIINKRTGEVIVIAHNNRSGYCEGGGGGGGGFPDISLSSWPLLRWLLKRDLTIFLTVSSLILMSYCHSP
jgi:hypothetical protein